MKIKIYNPDLSAEERTYLESDYSSGVTLTVRNNDGFTANWFVVVGEPGQEQTESSRISSITGNTTITLNSALKFSHSKSTPIYLSRWDKLSAERSTTSTGTFIAITDSPFAIEWDDADLKTLVEDDTGTSASYYKWRTYNSITNTYGSYSDVLPGTGMARDTVGYAITQIRRNPLTKEIDDETIIEFFNDFQDLVYEEIPDAWWFRKEGTAKSTVADTYKYAITTNWSDFLSMEYLLYKYVNGSNTITYPLTFSPAVEFYNFKSDASQPSDDNAKFWTFLPGDATSPKGYIGIHPTPDTTACYLQPVYNFSLTDLDSFGDTLVIPRTKAYVDYALYRIADDIKLDATNADKYMSRVQSSITALKKRKKRQLGQPELMRFRGQRGWSRLFGEQSGYYNSDAYREYYW